MRNVNKHSQKTKLVYRKGNEMNFNAVKFIDDCGGISEVARVMGKHRTAPYRIIRSGYIGSPLICKLLERNPHLNMNDYFNKDTYNDRDSKR